MNNSVNSIKLTGKCQITVPAQVVRQLGLQRGDLLQYTVQGRKLVLMPRPSVREYLRDTWVENAQANTGQATDDSIKKTLRDYHTKQTDRP